MHVTSFACTPTGMRHDLVACASAALNRQTSSSSLQRLSLDPHPAGEESRRVLSSSHIVVLFACMLLWNTTCRASGDPAHAHLVWQTPAGQHCIVQRELERGVEALLARDVFVQQDRADELVVGSIVRRDGSWLASVTLRSAAGQALGVRELSNADADCAALNRPLIIVLATLLDTPVDLKADLGAGTRGFGVGLALGLNRGVLPRSALTAGALGMYAPGGLWPTFWLEAQGLMSQTLRDNAGHGGRFQAFQGTLSACPSVLHSTSFELAACVGAQLGWLRGWGLGLVRNRAQSRFTGGVLFEPALSLRLLPHMSARLSAALSVALDRPTFYFDAMDGSRHSIHRPQLFGAMVRLGFIVDRF